jgi:hypothetical protein
MVRVARGSLRLTSQQTRNPFICFSPAGSFATTYKASSVTTRDRFSQAFGRFEFRARFTNTTATGLHAALWLYPSKLTYGGWPSSGEIDVAEWFSKSHQYVFPSVHFNGTGSAERTAGVARLYEIAKAAAADLGQSIDEGTTGGGSDGNFCAAIGVPTLDGLGALGDGAHALHEHVLIPALAPRAALLARLLQRLTFQN